MRTTKNNIDDEKIVGFRINVKTYQEIRTMCASKKLTTTLLFNKLLKEWLEKEWKRSNEVIERAKVG